MLLALPNKDLQLKVISLIRLEFRNFTEQTNRHAAHAHSPTHIPIPDVPGVGHMLKENQL